MGILLITGGSGFVGGHLLRFSSFEKTYATYHSAKICESEANYLQYLDITDKMQVTRLIQDIVPDVVIHTAALAGISLCAKYPEKAWNINVKGTEYIASAAQQIGARLIYLSTDQIFDGLTGPYLEYASPHPLSYYGHTKWLGENIVSSICSNFCIARTSFVYGWSINTADCFTETMIEDLRQGKKLTLFTDEYRTPIYVDDLCGMLLELAEKSDLQGIFHLCNNTHISRFEFGVKLCAVFDLDKGNLIPISIDTDPRWKTRPKNCTLHSAKIKHFLISKARTFDLGLLAMQQAEIWIKKRKKVS